jgi:hypothetical protein
LKMNTNKMEKAMQPKSSLASSRNTFFARRFAGASDDHTVIEGIFNVKFPRLKELTFSVPLHRKNE